MSAPFGNPLDGQAVNPFAERAVIAALCRHQPDDAARCIIQHRIVADLFAGDPTREAFIAIGALVTDGVYPDAATLMNAISSPALIEVETSLKEHVSTANLPAWIKKLKDCHRERLAQAARDRLINAAVAGCTPNELRPFIDSIEQAQAGEADHPPRFLWAEDFCQNSALEDDLIEGYIPAGSVGVIFGDSQAYKSFLLIDIAGHIATGRRWRGLEVRQGKVLFIAGEGSNGLRLRVKAWFERHGEPMRNFAISIVPLELCDPKNAELLIADIRHFIGEERFLLIVLDTLNTHFGAGDENATADMSRFRGSALRLSQATQATVGISHHCGLQDKGRGRGSISLHNGIDWEFKLERSGDYTTLTNTKVKDGTTPPPLSWKLAQQPLPWADKKGNPINGAVLEPADTVKPECHARLSRPNRIALDALNSVIQAGDDHALIADWRAAALAARLSSAESRQGKHAAFNRAVDSLVDAKLVRIDGNRCYPTASTASTNRQHVDFVDAGIGASPRQQKPSTHPPLYGGVDVVDADAQPQHAGNARVCASSETSAEQAQPTQAPQPYARVHSHRGVGINARTQIDETPNPRNPDEPPAATPTDSPLARRILAALDGHPGGMDRADLLRMVGNGKGSSPAMLDAEVNRLLLARRIATVNGNLVLEVRP